jgi:beta-glucanase (GH16 family)
MKRPNRSRLAWGLLVAASLIVGGLQACRPTDAPGPRAEGRWEVDFRETFAANTLDADRWGTCHWWDVGEGCTISSNDEDQWHQPEAVQVGDGRLELTAEPAPSAHLGETFNYRSGMVSSGRPGDEPADEARYAFTFGSVEVRFRTPAGAGLWPAVWMLPVTNESRPEIDLLEQYGEDTTEASMTLHATDAGEPVRDRHYETTSDLSEGWHTVGLDWTTDQLTWFLDGEEVFRVTGDRVPQEPMYLVLNLAVRGGTDGPNEQTGFPARFLVDEITVWRQQ